MNDTTQLAKTLLENEDTGARSVTRLLEIQDTRLFHMKQQLDKLPHGWQRQVLQGAIIDLEDLCGEAADMEERLRTANEECDSLMMELDELKTSYATLLDERNDLNEKLNSTSDSYARALDRADVFEAALEKIREVCDDNL